LNKLWYDYETTGLDSKKHGIMTAYFVICNEKDEFLDELELFLKPDKGNFVVESEALKVTGIDLDTHLKDPRTITYSEGKKRLIEMLERHKIKGKRRHYRPCGQNIGFDEQFTVDVLVPEEEWRRLVHYRNIDTLQILNFLQDVGFLPKELGNLESQVEYFNLPMGQAHNAKEDVKMVINVYRAYCKLMQDKKDNMAGVSNNSLLEIVER